MAINLNYSIIEHKKDVKLDPAVDTSTLERGQIMVHAGYTAGGEAMVAPAAGAASERVLGVLWLSETKQSTLPTFEDLTVPAAGPFTLTLRKTPQAGEISAFNTTSGAAIVVVAGAPAAGQIGYVGDILTADAALASVDFRVTYRYAISAEELERRGGRRSVNQGAEGLYSQVTLAYGECNIALSNFEVSEQFEQAANVDLLSAANGSVSFAGAGSAVGMKAHAPRLLNTPGIEQAFINVEAKFPGV